MLFDKLNLYNIHFITKINGRYLSRVAATNFHILRDCFGMSQNEAETYVLKNKLNVKNSDHVLDVIKFCRKIGYRDEEILNTPNLLGTHPIVLEDHYLTMEEGGFENIRPEVLTKYRIHNSKSVATLKLESLIHSRTNVTESFVKWLDPQPNYLSFGRYDDKDLWRDIHIRVIKTYLKWRLETTEDEIDVLFRVHKMVKSKSIRTLCENIKIAKDLGFSNKKLLNCGYILHMYPKYPKTVLQDFPNLAGADMRKMMLHYPKLITTSPKSILKIYGILKEFGISDEAIQHGMNVFHMSPQTVQLRLEEICKTPELKVLMNNPNILKLVVHHNRAKSRLTYLQSVQLQCPSLLILGTTPEKFDNYMKDGKDVNHLNEVIVLLKSLLHKDAKYFEKNLRKHPFHLQVPLVRIEETYRFLKEKKFKDSSISKAVQILLYPRDKIKQALRDIKQDSTINKSAVSEVDLLNLVLYNIEKEHHFTGNGIWQKKMEHVVHPSSQE